MEKTEITFRPARVTDAMALTDIFLTAFAVSVPGLPLAHTRDEIAGWFATKQIHEKDVTVAIAAERPVAFIAVDDGWIHQLFVSPDHHNQGLGSALIRPIIASASRPVRLWAFQRNAQARTFYERRGFVAELFTDGSTNEERTPDVLYVWRPLR